MVFSFFLWYVATLHFIGLWVEHRVHQVQEKEQRMLNHGVGETGQVGSFLPSSPDSNSQDPQGKETAPLACVPGNTIQLVGHCNNASSN